MKELILRLKTYMEQRKLTVRDMASAMNCKERTLANKLRGDRDFGSDELVMILSVYSDISAEWLFRGKGEMLLNAESNIMQPSLAEELLNRIIDERIARAHKQAKGL